MAGRAATEDLTKQVRHFEGCPQVRIGAGGIEVDLYETYTADTPTGKARVARCLLCGAHYVLRPDGSTVHE
jgi:hypothetical protein